MFDLSRLTRLITVALASCAVTWALAGGALAMPAPARPDAAAPAYDPFVADSDKAPVAQAPSYKGVPGDTAKAPDPAQVRDVLNGIGRGKTPGAPVVAGGNDDTGTIALILSIAAMLTALGAVTLTVTRTHRPPARA
jgi:hypothetical protein